MKGYREEILKYIEEHINDDINSLLLKKSPFDEHSIQELAAQVKGRQVAKKKFPFLLNYPQYKFPVKVSLEQASSEQTGFYKSSFLSGESLLDLTGGMGIDTYLIGKNYKSVTYVDINQDLCKLAEWNLKTLGLNNFEVENISAEEYTLKKEFDTIYIDPSRRVNGNRKYDINDLVPNIIQIQDALTKNAKQVIIKLSPMQDIKSAKQALQNIAEIHYISLNGEMKEVLFILKKGSQNITEKIILLGKKNTSIVIEKEANISFSEIQNYIYLPDAAIMKSGKHDTIASQYGLNKINKNTHLYTSKEINQEFPGRAFCINSITTLNKKKVQELLTEKKANIIAKNFPLKPDEIKKKIGIKNGGDEYIIAFTDHNNKKIVAVCKKVY